MTSGFSPLAMQLLRDRPSFKKLDTPTHVGRAGEEGCGDYVVAEFLVVDGVVKDFGYRCNGCPTTYTCSEILGKLIAGRDWKLRSAISGEVLAKLLGEAAEGKGHIPEFVASTLGNIVENNLEMREQRTS